MKKELIAHKLPKSPISELFRTLRTNIQFMNTKNGLKSLMVTSTTPGEGKTWVTANLAVTFAQAGKRVILIDCDLRKGRQFSIFGIPPTPGLSNFLSGVDSKGEESSNNILEYVKQTEVDNLFVLPAGSVPPNPSELLVSPRMQDCISKLKEYCDLIIIDTTPSSLVTDAVIISRYVDTSIIVASYKSTKMEDLKNIKREIENVGGKIAGVVMNKVPTTAKKYTSSYYYGSTSSSITSKSNLKQNSEGKRLNKITSEDAKNDKPQVDNNENLSGKELLKQMQEYVKQEKDKLNGDKND